MFRRFTLIAIFVLPQVSFAAGTFGIADLPSSPEKNNPVCYDESNGQLGNCSAGAMKEFENIVWVAKNGTGDYDDPVQALNDINWWCPVRSTQNRCVIRIAPGIWEMGSTPIVLQSWVHIQGSGGPELGVGLGTDFITGATILKGTVSGLSTGVVIGAQYSSIRDLVVINESTGNLTGVAIYHQDYYLTIKNVYAKAIGSVSAYGLVVASTSGGGAAVTAESSTFVGEGTTRSRGIYVSNQNDANASVSLRNCDAHTRSGSDQLGILLVASPPTNLNWSTNATIRHSKIQDQVTVAGAGRVQLLVEHSNILNINNLGTGNTNIRCAFVTSGVYGYSPYSIHTDTCPLPPP